MKNCCLILLMAIIALSSCSTSDLSESESEPVSLTVNISKQTPTTVTRAISDAIDNMKIMVFNAQGYLIGSAYTTASPTSVSVPVRTSAGCTICAIANAGNSSYFDGISTITELRTKVTTPVTSATTLAGKSNEILYGETPGVNITTSTASQSVSLKRLYSKYTFTIIPSSDIVITSYQLCNVPNECFLASGNTSNPTAGYSGLDYSAVTTSASVGGTVTSPSYYVYENLAGKNNSLTTMEDRTSANAPSGASYLLINAQRNTGWGANWKSTYRIYLGGVTSAITPVVDCTNFNIYRNYDYNCNISISGSGSGDTRVTYTPVPYSGRSNTYIGDAVIGNLLYDDGTTGTEFNADHTVGIIFSNEITQAQYNAGCRHGKVFALKTANGKVLCHWSSANNSPYTNHSSTGYIYTTDFKTCFDDVSSGYDALNSNLSYVNDNSNNAWYYCRNYNDGTSRSNTALFTNTGWYLPSAGELRDVMENLGTWTPDQLTTLQSMRTSTMTLTTHIINNLPNSNYFSDLNATLLSCSGDIIDPGVDDLVFWSASETDDSHVVKFSFLSSYVDVRYASKTVNGYARAVLAF